MTEWQFGPLKQSGYDLIMVDVPTEHAMRSPKGEVKTAQAQYGCLSIAQAKKLPIGHLSKPDGALLFQWWTWPRLLYGGDIKKHFRDHDASRSEAGELMKTWGARYVSGGAWFKRTKHGKPGYGPGYRVRTTCEPFLLGIFGNPDSSTGRNLRNIIESIEENCFDGLRREHSTKPEEAYAWCEQYFPGGRFCEIFSRRSRRRWDTWGYEAGKFDPTVKLQAPANDTVAA